MIFAERFGFTGTGGGGTSESRVRRERWRALRVVSSSLKAREFDEVDMAFEVGSRCNGRRVNVSESSMVGYCARI